METRFFRVSVLLLIAGCLLAGQSSSGQEQELWRTDWLKFGEAIAPYAKTGALERKGDFLEFNRIFSHEVEWSGTLKEFHANSVAKFLDLEMLLFLHSYERTEAEYRALFERAGFKLTRILPTQSPCSVIEGLRL